jgi:predicted enzyme related to lactoylglutathione lyase
MKIRTVYFKVSDMDQAVSFWEKFLKTTPHKRSPWWSEFRCETINFGLLQTEDFKTGGEGSFIPVFEVIDAELENTKTAALQAGAKIVVNISEHPDKKSYVLADPFGNEFEITKFHD